MKKKTILFVAMPDSIHTARWMEQLQGQGWDIHLFPSTVVAALHPRIVNITIHYLLHSKYIFPAHKTKPLFLKFFERAIYALLRRGFTQLTSAWQAKRLARIVDEIQPDVVHSMEMQAAGYLTLAAKKHCKKTFPSWIVTIWGSDIFWFGRFLEHQDKIHQVLSHCDYFFCECRRDKYLARNFGFNKIVLPRFPATGGFDLASLVNQRNSIQPSKRKVIALKGYQHWVGRALIALQALEQCLDELRDYQIIIYSATSNVIKAAHIFSLQTGIGTKIMPSGSAHTEILALHGVARISIGLSLSDGVSNGMLEAMVMGSFPIQSCTACADEWIEHGVSGAIVPAEEADIIAMWIRKALTDDVLVDNAARINWQTALARLDGETLKQQAIAIYNAVESR